MHILRVNALKLLYVFFWLFLGQDQAFWWTQVGNPAGHPCYLRGVVWYESADGGSPPRGSSTIGCLHKLVGSVNFGRAGEYSLPEAGNFEHILAW